jgi:hypothetical protein
MPISDKSWLEWSQQVLKELAALNAKVETLDERQELLRVGMEERYAHIESKLEKMNVLLTGNGTPEKGLIIRVDRLERSNVDDLELRVDRLEQTDSRRTWLLRSAVVAAIAAFCSTVASYFKNG